MAGLGGTCTHVSALMFYIEAAIRTCMREKKTVTQGKAWYWLLPSSINKVPYAEVSNIDFTSAKSKKKQFDSCVRNLESGTPSPQQSPMMSCQSIPAPSDTKISNFFKKLHVGGARSAILSVTEPYNKDFIPKDAKSSLPKPLTDLINEECTGMKEDELRRKCQGIKIVITQKEADLIECKTREQSKSKIWFKYHAGRITASRMKAACRTKLDNPARSLIKAICYPESALFATKATNWGCEHEQCARDEYVKYTSQNHDNFKIEQAGLFINPTHPHLGEEPA